MQAANPSPGTPGFRTAKKVAGQLEEGHGQHREGLLASHLGLSLAAQPRLFFIHKLQVKMTQVFPRAEPQGDTVQSI